MAGPPDTLTSDQLWAQLTQMPRPFRVVPIPRRDPVTGAAVGSLAIQILTQEEQMICNAAAERFARTQLKDALPKANEAQQGYEDLYKNAASIELLAIACRKAEKLSEPFFPSPKMLAHYFTPDEIGTLVMHYFSVQHETGPIVAQLSVEELEAWVKRVAEGGSRLPFDLLSWEALKNLAFTLACRLHSLSTATSSAGSPPAEPTSNEPAAADAEPVAG